MNKIFFGDCIKSMEQLPAGIAHTCVTSPPYFGLRDYGHEGQIGLEPTPDEFVAKLVAVFREVRRVLRDDGTLWLNLGDSYSVQHIGRRDHGTGNKTSKLGPNKDGLPGGTEIKANGNRLVAGLKPKDLIGIPWRVAFALQADGWYLRQDIIWHKPNPMPESVTDRCTKSHEYIFLLSKSERYYFDHEAIKEPLAESSIPRLKQNIAEQVGTTRHVGKTNGNFKAQGNLETGLRNRRDVWTVTTKPYKGAHFATFPPDLITPCVLAGAPPEGVVLDPFMGSGTTAMVAVTHGRRYIGCELNPEYAPLQDARISSLFADMI
jgi:DNA modification methylase